MPDWFKLEAHHVLTIASILASLLTFYLGWRKERRFARRRQADEIRLGAAALIAKLGRWRELSLSLFDEIEAGFVEASDIAARNPDRLDFAASRDFLWKEISRARAAVRRQVIQEDIQTSHAQLIAYCPGARLEFLRAFSLLDIVETRNFHRLREATQAVILGFGKSAEPYQRAKLGNALRACANDVSKQFLAELEPIQREAIAELNTMINRTDEELIFDRRGLSGPPAGDASVGRPSPAA